MSKPRSGAAHLLGACILLFSSAHLLCNVEGAGISKWCDFPVAQMVKHLSTMWETQVRFLGWEDPLEKEMAIHSSTIA